MRKGWGPGYQYNCVHSGTIRISGDLPTAWYNYVLASAGTIINENTSSSNPAYNTNTAAESVCPKGWTLPDDTQIRSIGPSGGSTAYISIYSPIYTGFYGSGNYYGETERFAVWGSETANGGVRNSLQYGREGKLVIASNFSSYGFSIRCVQKSTQS